MNENYKDILDEPLFILRLKYNNIKSVLKYISKMTYTIYVTGLATKTS